MDRKGAKLDPQGLFQKFCAGSCTRIKAHNNGIVVNILEVERSTHPKTGWISRLRKRGEFTNGSQISSFRDWLDNPGKH